MRTVNKSILLEIMRTEYRRRLREAVNEVDIFDDRDNMVLGKGLKVRHKETQLEYTIDDVFEDPDGKVMIRLNLPEDPRFDPPPSDEVISDSPPVAPHPVLGEDDLLTLPDGPIDDGLAAPEAEEIPADTPTGLTPGEEAATEYIVIDKEEFEKEYEVK